MAPALTHCPVCQGPPQNAHVFGGTADNGLLVNAAHVCLACAHVRILTSEEELRPLSPEEFGVLDDPQIIELRRRIDLRAEFYAWCSSKGVTPHSPYQWDRFLEDYRAQPR